MLKQIPDKWIDILHNSVKTKYFTNLHFTKLHCRKWFNSHKMAAQLTITIFIIVTLIVFLTELTSNQATTATFVPIMIAIAGSDLGLISQLSIPVALAASCAFMLPVATPPNAIVYGSEKFTIAQMMRAGFYLNVVGIVVVTIFSAYVLPLIFN